MIFFNIEKDKGSVSFRNKNSAKVLGKGKISLGSKKYLAENVFLVDNMKHNLLSISQMCDQGHELIFNSKGCKIRKQGSRKLVATTTRTPNNIYVLDEIESEKCHLGKEDESWLWHRRMGHIHFDNLVKIYKNQAVRNMLEFTKPANFVCEQCQHGKQIRVHFKMKEHPSTKPLELVHSDLCGPTKRKGLNG